MKRLVMFGALVTACFTPTHTAKTSEPPPAAPPPFPQEVITVAEPPPVLLSFVKKANRELSADEAERVARLVQQVAEEEQLDVALFGSIIRHESNFVTGQKQCQKLSGRRNCDYGLAQVNSFWIDELELDAAKLRYDDLYNLRIGARILKDVLTRHKGPLGYVYYHSATPELQPAYTARVEMFRKAALVD